MTAAHVETGFTPAPMQVGILTRDLHTPLGIHPAGAPIVILQMGRASARLCLDFGLHLTGRCHAVTVPADQLEPHAPVLGRRKIRRAS